MAVKEQEAQAVASLTGAAVPILSTNVVRGAITFYELKPPLDPQTRVVGRIEEISDQEISFRSPEPVKRGARINMHFRITNMSKKERAERSYERPFHAIGRVRSCDWNEKLGQFLVVARFTDIFEEDRKFLRKFVTTRTTTNNLVVSGD